MGILRYFLGCPHKKKCGNYRETAFSCNEGYKEGYCGKEQEARKSERKFNKLGEI